ncbi:hypothetical protein EDD25_1034 [Cryobacterium psychrophilum]|nr:hypothetical protein EDD25_1034 [Cryobacterium psychrophilum]
MHARLGEQITVGGEELKRLQALLYTVLIVAETKPVECEQFTGFRLVVGRRIRVVERRFSPLCALTMVTGLGRTPTLRQQVVNRHRIALRSECVRFNHDAAPQLFKGPERTWKRRTSVSAGPQF